MAIFDLILILIVFGFVWFGFWKGLVQVVGEFISLIFAVIFASRWYEIVSLKLLPFLSSAVGGNVYIVKIIAFLLVFIAAHWVIYMIFKLLNRIFSFIPIVRSFNRLGGAALGFAEGAITIGFILSFLGKFPFGEGFAKLLIASNVAPFLVNVSKVLIPLLPEAFKQIKSLI